MTANLQKQIDTLGTRTGSLENVLGQFIASMNRMMARREADTEAFRTSVENSMARMEADTEAFKSSVENSIARMEADTEAFKSSVENSIARMEADTKKHKKEMDKKWGELSNRLGTLVEDMVAPNIRGIAGEFFGDHSLKRFGIRTVAESEADPGRRREFDVIAMSDRNFYVGETKSKPTSHDVRSFVRVLSEIRDYFPEIGDRRVIPILASLHIPENIMTHLTRNRIYAMAMGEDTMTLLNFQEVQREERDTD